jgi:hypothetical protein
MRTKSWSVRSHSRKVGAVNVKVVLYAKRAVLTELALCVRKDICEANVNFT